jgi:wyosine [tRNA(Phe)-imidazoG37] synthetase (radical SAM superfamily)
MIAFGPVPSRRLGQSLGINNIPPKVCSYSCIYCQVGRTDQMVMIPRTFYSPEEIFFETEKLIDQLDQRHRKIDNITFVSDGEPTLDLNLGREIDLLRNLETKIAVISNASLVWQKQVQQNLKAADWVSLKVDTVNEQQWHKINRPHYQLQLDTILMGMRDFSESFSGILATETMLVKGLNDHRSSLIDTAKFIAELNPTASYISIPTRPPAEPEVNPPEETLINEAFHIFSDHLEKVELLIEYEGDQFNSGENVAEAVLNICSVHPMRKEAITKMLEKRQTDWSVIRELLNHHKIIEIPYNGFTYYLRKFR